LIDSLFEDVTEDLWREVLRLDNIKPFVDVPVPPVEEL